MRVNLKLYERIFSLCFLMHYAGSDGSNPSHLNCLSAPTIWYSAENCPKARTLHVVIAKRMHAKLLTIHAATGYFSAWVQVKGFQMIGIRYFNLSGIVTWFFARNVFKRKSLDPRNVRLNDPLFMRWIPDLSALGSLLSDEARLLFRT